MGTKQEVKHTPGPWYWYDWSGRGDEFDAQCLISGDESQVGCFIDASTDPGLGGPPRKGNPAECPIIECFAVSGGPPRMAICSADASLIAAAPDLLAACEEALEFITMVPEIPNHEGAGGLLAMKMQDAIAKATGK